MSVVYIKICSDANLQTLTFFPDWFVTNKMHKNLDNALFFNENIGLHNDDPDNVMQHFLMLIWALLM